MILENISYLDKENLIELTIAGEVFLISYDFYSFLDLNTGDELDLSLYKDILSENNFNRCKQYALRQISYTSKTSYDLKNKLYKKGYSKDNIDRVIYFLKSFNLINDDLYVKNFVNDKSKISMWSKSKIRYMLKSKFIDDSLIDEYLNTISYEEEYKKAKTLALRRFDLGHSRDKIYRFLAYRGFSYDIIRDVLEELFV